MKLLEQIRNFAKGAEIIRDWLGHDGEVVPQIEAQRRADICITCEFNVHGMALTESVAVAIKEQIEAKNHLRLRVNGEKKLGHCAVCSCVNRLAIWCPIQFLTKHSTRDEIEKFPSHCWKRESTV